MRNPYVTGPYVTGDNHYGRHELIDFLLHGEGRAYWVVGNRRIGKTSLLRELERLVLDGDRMVPLVWDMQGCNSFAALGRYLADAVHDSAVRFEALGLPPTAFQEEDALVLLGALRRQAMRAGRELLLLCDETEVLINIARQEPEAMQRLHAQLTGGAGLRVVATSTHRIYLLHDVCREWPTSSFLGGFDMSRTLGGLDQAAAEALITQAQALADERVAAAPETVAAICEATNNHPFLIQMLCARLFVEGTLRSISDDDLRVDSALAGFFAYDFRQLTDADRLLMLSVHRAGRADPATLADGSSRSELSQRLYNLVTLGYLRRVDGRVAPGNAFLAAWLGTEAEALQFAPPSQTSEAALRTALQRQQAQDIDSLISQLNARRARLVELEFVRAREFLAVAPQVLDEIEQLQTEIAELRSLLERRRPS